MSDFPSKPVQRVEVRTLSFERLLDSDEAAALLKIHPKTLQRMARAGQIRGVQIGRLWRFHVPLRRCDFYDDRALCRDVRRKLEFWLDPAAIHTLWDRTWNQWKHLLATKIEVEGTFVQTGKYRKRHAQWELVTWETALPSRLGVKLPSDFQQQIESAKTAYHRFGQYSRALDQIRLCLEHWAVERAELERMCSELRLPGDFDVG